MAPRTQNRSFRRALALARLSPAAILAASALLAIGCQGPVSPTFELYFAGSGLGDASCSAAAMEDVRLMCDSTVRIRILDTYGKYDLVPPVCQDLNAPETGTMQALEQLDVELPPMRLGPAMVQVEIWRAGILGSLACPGTEHQDGYPENELSAESATPAVIGQARFEVGADAHVRVPLECPDLAQVNRFAPGCGLDVEIGDLDRGTKLRAPPRNVDREDEVIVDGEEVEGSADAEPADIDLEDLQVVYGYARSEADGSWEFSDHGVLALHVRSDGTAVWRDRPNEYFWNKLDEHKTLCIQVTKGDGETPQLSCVEAGAESPSWRMQASYLPPEDLACLLAANGASTVPEQGIVMGRVVQPVVENQNEVEVERPAANVQVFPTTADQLPEAPEPQLKLAAAALPSDDGDDADGRDDAATEVVKYVSKEPEVPSRVSQACRVVLESSATTDSGYFLSDASFPAHWEVETGSRIDQATHSSQATAEVVPGRTVVGGRLPGAVSIVRIPLRR